MSMENNIQRRSQGSNKNGQKSRKFNETIVEKTHEGYGL